MNPYGHLLPPEKPRNSVAVTFPDLDCYPSPEAILRSTAVEIIGTAFIVGEAAKSLAANTAILVWSQAVSQ